MKNLFFVFLSILVFYSCDFKKSAHKDLVTGLSTTGDGLSCQDVSIFSDNNVVQRSTFTFGEVITFKFKNIEGFNEENGNVFPGMSILIRDSVNNIVLQNDDVYANYSEGINLSPLVLTAEATLARPIHSGKRYNLLIKIWDKKGDGKFSAEMSFDVKPNNKISVSRNYCNYDEVYLFSEKNNKVITDNSIQFGENVFLIFEGVKEFVEETEKIYPGLSLIIRDSKNEIILSNEDLFKEYEQTGIEASIFKDRVSANFWFNGSEVNNPLSLEAKLWDKKSDKFISVKTSLNLK
jgi:hypothetical protein